MVKTYVEIEVDLDEFSDEAIAAEAAERGLPQAKHIAVDAINAIRQGRYDDAVTMLEREFLPKWTDRAACEAAYREAMGRA